MEGEKPNHRHLTGIIRRMVDKILPQQLKGADLNPHEGRLRGSLIPRRHMNIPDHPPTDNQKPPEVKK